MANWYIDRDSVKLALQIPASTTGEATGQRGLVNQQIDDAIEAISRAFDEYVGYHFYPSSGTRYFTAKDSDCLYLRTPLTALDAIHASSDGGSTYGTTIATGNVYLNPPNATEESPQRPYWEIEIKPNATGDVFPAGLRRGVRVQGTWGYYNALKSTTATLATALNATATTIELNGATALHAGQTILMGGERMFVSQTPASSSSTHSSQITVQRAVNGSSGATHSCATTIDIYDYPIISRAALYQASQDYRAKDAPMGVVGMEPLGTQRFQGGIGLHPFTRRLLDSFRTPVVG